MSIHYQDVHVIHNRLLLVAMLNFLPIAMEKYLFRTNITSFVYQFSFQSEIVVGRLISQMVVGRLINQKYSSAKFNG